VPLLGGPELVAAQAAVAGRLQRAQEARAHHADEQEVVEVAGLERGVLRLSVKPRSLRVSGGHPRLWAVHPAQRAGDEHRGGGASALGRQRGQAGAIAGRAALGRRSAGRSGTYRA
jgi:hypothetical protein